MSDPLQAPEQLGTKGPDVAECVREARRALEGRPHLGAMVVGDRSVRLQTALAPLRAAIEHRALMDAGYGDDSLEPPPETVRITARNLASLDVLAETFWTWLETRGPLTAKGKTRSAVTTLLAIIDRQTKLTAVLG